MKKQNANKCRHKIHILIVSQYFYPEIFRINDMAVEWVNRGYRVTVLTGIPNYPMGKFYDGYSWVHRRSERWNGVTVIRIPLIARGHSCIGMAANYLSFAASGFLWKTWSNLKADCVFTFEVSPMTQALVGVWYAKKHKIPSCLYVQDLWPENVETMAGIRNKFILGTIDRMVDYIYQNTDEIFATSPAFAEAIVQRRVPVSRKKVHFWPQYAEDFYQVQDRHTVRNCAQKDSALQKIPDDGSFKIVFAGSIGYAQGLDLLPRTAELLKQEDVKFVVVGDGRYQKELEKEISVRRVSDRFIMIRRQQAEMLPGILALCDAAFLSFMDTALFEKTIPAKLQSYMACGMPVLASAKGETRRIIEEAECGICCGLGDAAGCADAVRRLMAADLKAMGTNSRLYFEQHFDKKKLMDEMEQYIRNLVNRRDRKIND